MNNELTMIIDNGTDTIKSGLLGQQQTKCIIPNIIGRPKYTSNFMPFAPKEFYIGEEALMKRGVLKLSCPLADGHIQDFQLMAKVWYHTIFNQIRQDPADANCILILSKPHNQHEMNKIKEILFQQFEFSQIYIGSQCEMLAQHCTNKTGVVVSSGLQSTHVIPYIAGKAVLHAALQVPLGGVHVEQLFRNIYKYHDFNSTVSDQLLAKDLKHKLFYVASNYQQQTKKYQKDKKFHTVYDVVNQQLAFGKQKFESCQILFTPKKYGKQSIGLHDAIGSSIQNVQSEYHSVLLSSIVLSGGNSMFQGIGERLMLELSNKMEFKDYKVGILGQEERIFMPWVGAAKKNEYIKDNKLWITKQEYLEKGQNLHSSKMKIY